MQLHHALQQLHRGGVKLGIGSLFQLGCQLLDAFGADVELMGMRHSFRFVSEKPSLRGC